jgi:hypothetical protein
METATRKAISTDLAALKARTKAGARSHGRKPGATLPPPRLSRAARDRSH